MKLWPLALAAALVAIASSCSTSDPAKPVIRTVVVKPPLPAEAAKACDKPIALPPRDISEKEVTSFWGRDRAALVECEARRSAAVAAFQ